MTAGHPWPDRQRDCGPGTGRGAAVFHKPATPDRSGTGASLSMPEVVSGLVPGFQRYITTGVPDQPPKG